MGSTGKRGRPSTRCETHKNTCVVPGCKRAAESPTCQYHRVKAGNDKKRLERDIAKGLRILTENGYDITPPHEYAPGQSIDEWIPKQRAKTYGEDASIYAIEGTIKPF